MNTELKQKLIIAALTALISGIISNMLGEINWAVVLVVFVLSIAVLQLFQFLRIFIAQYDNGKKKGITTLVISIIFLLIVALVDNILGPYFSSYLISDYDVSSLICGYHWVTYDPLTYDPVKYPNPNISAMQMELDWIKNAGFEGVITFTSRDNFSEIPRLAKERGLRVIMGIWNPNDKNEVALALSQREYVDAYVVGHNGLNNPIAGNPNPYNEKELVQIIQMIRYRSRRPVSTTELLDYYIDDPNLINSGDWVFPDVHMSLGQDNKQISPIDAISQTISMANNIAITTDKPILLKMVAYPASNLVDSSPTKQVNFFSALFDIKRSALENLPSNVCISVHSAFDTDWKRDFPFYGWDMYTGLLDETGVPRPAVAEIIKRRP